MRVIFVLAFCVILTSCVHGSKENIKARVKAENSELYKIVQERIEEQQEKNDIDKYYDRTKSFFQLLRMALDDFPNELNSAVDIFVNKLRTLQSEYASRSTTTSVLECPSESQCQSASHHEHVKDIWSELVKSFQKNDDECEPCQVNYDGLQELACTTPWEPIRDAIITSCEALFGTIGVDPIICNGTFTLQGPHVYCIAKEATPFEMCESLNQCYPSSGTLPKRARSMPWELKDSLQPKLQKKLLNKKRRRTRKSKNTLTVVQLSDIHVQPNYAVGSAAQCTAFLCCLERDIPRDGTQTARKWGEYSCNLPERTLRAFLNRVNEFDPDMIIYTGDSPPHTWWDESIDSQLNCSNIVVNAIKDIIPSGVKVYPSIGNHEMFPTNLYSMELQDTKTMNEIFTKMWHELAGLDVSANATFTDMSYYTVLHQPGLRMLCLNTLYDWYPANFYNSLNQHDEFNAAHKAFIDNTLSSARANGEKVIILGHHPIGGGSAILRTTTWWEDVANEYSDVIIMHISGHTHIDHQFLVVDPVTDEANAINLVTAVTTSIAAINPSLRVFELDSSTHELLNYQTHIFRIDRQNPSEEPVIELGYDAKEEYGMVDLSPTAWQDLVLRFIDDDALFQKWYANRNAKADLDPCTTSTCGENCKRSQICGIWFPRIDEADECVENWDRVTTQPPEPIETTEDPGSAAAASAVVNVVVLAAATFVASLLRIN